MTKQLGPQEFSDKGRGTPSTDRDPEAEAKRERKNLIARKKRALQTAEGNVVNARHTLQAWRDEESRLNSSRMNQISSANERLKETRAVVAGLKEELRSLGANVD